MNKGGGISFNTSLIFPYMKTLKLTFLGFLFSTLCFSLAFSQSKKELQAEVGRLQEEIFALSQENMLLRKQREQLTTQNETLAGGQGAMSAEINRLERRISVMEQEYQDLVNAYEKMKAGSLVSNTVPPSTNNGPDRSNSGSTCSLLENQLTDNTSYTQEYTRLNSSGWGVQVYSFGSLCQAETKAQAFSKKYKMYQTYIRVKQVNGRRVYSVIYGSLKDEAQARTYCNNFRKIAKDKEGKSAFVVQH